MSRIQNYSKLKGIIEVISVTIITLICYWIFETPNVIFIANLVIMFFVLFKAKFSYFSMKIVLMNYVLLAIFFQYTTGKSYGILEVSTLDLHYLQMNILIYLYNSICYIWINKTNILENEKELLNKNYKMSKLSIYFCCIIAIITAIIAFPGMPFNKSYITNRFVGLLQGNAWNHISIVCLIFLLPSFKKNNLVKFTYLFVVFWFISHYERVDIIGLLIFCFIYILVRKKDLNLRSYIRIGCIIALVLFVMVYLGEVRASNAKNITMADIVRKTLVQNTAADIGYVFNTSVDYYETNELLLGKSYFTYIIKLVPFLNSNIRAGKILRDTYETPGGEFILSEPLMNFGMIGVIVFQIIEFAIYSKILSKKSKYRFFLYCFLIATVFRTTWYGWIYIEKAVVYFIPIIYFTIRFLDSNIKRYKERGIKVNELSN